MHYLYIEIQSIDYTVFLSRLRQERSMHWIFNTCLVNSFTVKKYIKYKLESKLYDIAKEYGITAQFIKITEEPMNIVFAKTIYIAIQKAAKTIQKESIGGANMFNISATIKDIDYNEIADAIKEMAGKSNSRKNATMLEVIKIVEPFIDETMKTVPPSAIVQLFNLLAYDKVIKMARSYGVEIEDISIKPS